MQRIQVMGLSGSGKSTVGLRLAGALRVPHIELDAIHWLPGWVERDPDDFRAMVLAATEGDRWVVSGNYTSRLHQVSFWRRVDMIVWLDLPLRVTMPRQLMRSWGRWRSNELLWGTNTERFFPQLKFWDPNSLIGFTLRSYRRHRRTLLDAMHDPAWAHIRFVRLASQAEVDRFVAGIEAGAAASAGRA